MKEQPPSRSQAVRPSRPADPEMSISWIDRLLRTLLAAYGAVCWFLLLLVPLRFLPAEDAVILFQYSRNLAAHGAIAFLASGPRVEGATDFAWMLLIAGADRLGIAPFPFCAVVNALCLPLLAGLLCTLAGRPRTPLRLLTVMGAIALVPQILAAASGFAVLPDAVLLCALVLAVVRGRAVPAALLALLFCLFRPDAVVFAVPLLVWLVWQSGARARSLGWIAALFSVPGLLYFLWRWHYFHELFPLPFLVKTDTARLFGYIVPLSVHQSSAFLLFASILLVAALRGAGRRQLSLAIPLLVLPTLFYLGVRLDQNVAARFFYYLPLGAAILIALGWPTLTRARRRLVFRVGWAAWLLLLALPLLREVRTFRDEQFDGVKRIAEALGRLPRPGTLLTTEAGFLPYYSGWPTADAWGLNTPRFAHHFIQPGAVRELNPDLIVLHPDRTEGCVRDPRWPAAYPDRTWTHMTRNLVLGADRGQYDLWLTPYGSEFYRRRKGWQPGEGDRECWLVRVDSPLHDPIASILQTNGAVHPAP